MTLLDVRTIGAEPASPASMRAAARFRELVEVHAPWLPIRYAF